MNLEQQSGLSMSFVIPDFAAELTGWIGALLVFSSYYMRMMRKLRIIAIAANIFLLAYAFHTGSTPIIILQAILFPLNLYRVIQLKRTLSRMKHASNVGFDMEVFLPYMEKHAFTQGETLFRKSDSADRCYIVSTGKVRLTESGKTIEAGQVLGEIGIFSPDKVRTDTATVVEDAILYSLTDDTVRQLYVQDPAFGIYLTQLITGRMVENLGDIRGAA